MSNQVLPDGNGKQIAGTSNHQLQSILEARQESATAAARRPPSRPEAARQPARNAVSVWEEELALPTYLPAAPDKNPMFMEKRVYQGSSGKVYPLPFTDRIAETKTNRMWKAIRLENAFLRVLILPEIGGRIHAIQDKTNGYDLIYHQGVIKPALVGLAGPWISGGIEFNWPQHHRPATFLPVDFEIEEHPDGSKTVWCGDHDPMCRLKGMHGVCLHPDKAYLELKVRAHNRTPLTQTFLWWANVATRVHEAYQSFFPPDVNQVADHARRSMSEYPLCQGHYYGVNYGERGRQGIPINEVPSQFIPPHCQNSKSKTQNSKLPDYAPNDLSFYANIPTPCSYMCMGSRQDFSGGYDYRAQAGIVHVANHHISPGKKQWTWGNHDFGYAWDRNLTEADETGEFAPYIEIMAGVYTDNQPDFSFLAPGETKTWSQFWYPIQKIGPAQSANVRAAISLKIENKKIRVGVAVTEAVAGAAIELTAKGKKIFSATRDLAPGAPFVEEIESPGKVGEVAVHVTDSSGGEIISYQSKRQVKGPASLPATEPLPPEKIGSADELFITGLHLEQYRHATRCPTLYWCEALRRDPLDCRCNNAMGLWHLRRGEFAEAENHFRKAIERLTRRNANPADGGSFYNLGLCLRYWMDEQTANESSAQLFDDAYAAFYKATWSRAWAAAAYHALAEMDCRRSEWQTALDHLNRSLRFDTDNLGARDLKVMVLRKLGREGEAGELLADGLALDRLDWWARHLNGEPFRCDLQTRLDLAHDFARAGFYSEAIEVLRDASAETRDLPDQNWGARPMIFYTLGRLQERKGDCGSALDFYRRAAAEAPDYCFPSRLEEIPVLQSAMRANSRDARAPYYLGNLFYDRRRYQEAIRLWEQSAKLDPGFSIVWRNLGIGYFNISKKPGKARAAYDRAFQANPDDARLLFERDQLWKRLGENPAARLRELEKFPQLTSQRDDLSVELCALYNQTGRHERAREILSRRKFQPWEGGEGQALGQYTRTHLALGRQALKEAECGRERADSDGRKGEMDCAVADFKRAYGGTGEMDGHQGESDGRKRQMADFRRARTSFEFALARLCPVNLGEARHILANPSDVHYWLGVALDRLGEKPAAREHWLAAAAFKGDFQEMSVRTFSEMTFYSALALQKLGQRSKAKKLFHQLLAYAQALGKSEAKIDYFATSLPTMLLFDDDLQFRRRTTALFLEAQARFGLGQRTAANKLLQQVLRRDPNHAQAADLAEESPATAG